MTDLPPFKSTEELVRAAADAVEEAAFRLIGRDLGTVNRDQIVGAGVAVALRIVADRIDRGPTFAMPPSVISSLVRELADQAEAVR